MSCNSCDRPFCEACFTRYWLFTLQSQPQCPCCKLSWGNDESKLYLQQMKKYLHRDLKCGNILNNCEVLCPCNFLSLTPAPKDDADAVVVVTGTKTTTTNARAIRKSRKRKSSLKLADTKDPGAVEEGKLAASPEYSTCNWKGYLRDYDEHMISCHADFAPGSSWIGHLMNKLPSIHPQDYLQRVNCVKDLIKRFGTEEELQFLAQLSSSEVFMGISAEPFFEVERYFELEEGKNDYLVLTDPIKQQIWFELTSRLPLARPMQLNDSGSKVLSEFFLKTVFTNSVLPFLVDLPVILKESVLQYDQRFCGWFWLRMAGTLCRRMRYSELYELFHGLVKIINPAVIRASETCSLSFIYNVAVLEKIAIESRKLACATPGSQFFPFEERAFSLMAFSVRVVATWKIVVPSVQVNDVLLHMLLQAMTEALVNCTSVIHSFSGGDFDLLRYATLPLMCSHYKDQFYPIVLYSGAFRHALCVVRTLFGEECERQLSYKDRRNASVRGRINNKKGKRGRRNRRASSRSPSAEKARISNETEEVVDEDVDGNDSTVEESDPNDLKKETFVESQLQFPVDDMMLSLWVIARICESVMLISVEMYEEHYANISFLLSELHYHYSDIDFEKLLDISVSMLQYTIFLPSMRTINNLLVRIWFCCITMFGENKKIPKDDRILWSAGRILSFLSLVQVNDLMIDEFEYHLISSLMWKYCNLGIIDLHGMDSGPISRAECDEKAGKKLNHVRDVRAYLQLVDLNFPDCVGYTKVEHDDSEEAWKLPPQKRAFSSCMVDIERTEVLTALRTISSSQEPDDDEESSNERNREASPELDIIISLLESENDKSFVPDDSIRDNVDAAFVEARNFRRERESQYFRQILHGMDIIVLEHIFKGRLSRHVVSFTNTPTPISRVTRNRKSLLSVENAEPQEKFMCLAVPSTFPSSSLFAPNDLPLFVGVTEHIRSKTLIEWVYVTDLLGNVSAMYCDEAVVACFVLIFDLSTVPLKFSEGVGSRNTFELCQVHRLHSNDTYRGYQEAAQLQSSGPTLSTLPRDMFENGVKLLQTVLKEPGMNQNLLSFFFHLLCSNLISEDLQDSTIYRFFDSSSRVMMCMLADIIRAGHAVLNDKLEPQQQPRKSQRNKTSATRAFSEKERIPFSTVVETLRRHVESLGYDDISQPLRDLQEESNSKDKHDAAARGSSKSTINFKSSNEKK